MDTLSVPGSFMPAVHKTKHGHTHMHLNKKIMKKLAVDRIMNKIRG